MANNDANLDAELRGLLAEGRKIQAIKRYREATGAGLTDATQAVERLAKGEAAGSHASVDSALEAEIASLLEGGKKIEAVKLYRERTGLGLKEARDAVEAIAADRHIAVPKAGCLGVLLLSATIAGLSPAPSLVLFADDAPPATESKLVFDTYSGYFVSNQFEPDNAASFVVIDNKPQFNKVFGAAFVMGDKAHRLPKDAFQSNLVLAAIKRGKAVWEYKVEGAGETKGVVELRYTTTEKKSDSATFACPLIVSIPKGQYTAVQFVENGKPRKKIVLKSRGPQ